MHSVRSAAARLRMGSRMAVTAATVANNVKPAAPLRTVVGQPLFNTARLYATKSVPYTVDKFPGYNRNENFKKVGSQ